MKKSNILFLISATAVIQILICFGGCKKAIDDSDIVSIAYKISGDATAAQVVPAAAATGTGNITGFYDATYKVFTYTIRWKNLWTTTLKDTIIKANFYGPATEGQNSDSVRFINMLPTKMLNATDSTVNTLPANLYFNASEEAALTSGKWYFIISTKKFPAGIIRGQLKPTKL